MSVPTDACGMSVLKKLEQHPQQIRKAFEFIDDDKDGLITHKEFGIGLRIMGIRLDEKQIQNLTSKADPKRSGYVDYKEFLRELTQPPTAPTPRAKATTFLTPKVGQAGDVSSSNHTLAGIAKEREKNQGYQQYLDRVRDKVSGKSSNLTKVFRSFDKDHDGTLDYNELREGLASIGAEPTPAEFNALISDLDTDRNGIIEFEEFAQRIRTHDIDTNVVKEYQADPYRFKYAMNEHRRKGRATGLELLTTPYGSPSGRHSAAWSEVQDEALEQKVRSKIEGKQGSVKRAFERLDHDHDGRLSYGEFKRALLDFKVDLKEQEVDRLIVGCDANVDGFIDYTEFLRLFSGDKPSGQDQASRLPAAHSPTTESFSERSRRKSEEKIMGKVFEKVSQKSSSMAKVFRSFDTDGDGRLSYDEFRTGLEMLGVHCSEKELTYLVLRCDNDGSGYIDYNEFASFAKEQEQEESILKSQSIDPAVEKYLRKVVRNVSDSVTLSTTPKLQRNRTKEEVEYDAKVLAKFRAQLRGKESALRRSFEMLDIDRDGQLNYYEFIRGVMTVDPNFKKSEIERVLAAVDVNESGSIDFAEFSEALKADNMSNGHPVTSGQFSLKIADENRRQAFEFKRVLDRLTSKLEQKHKHLRDVFRGFDEDKDGVVSFSEFQEGLKALGVPVSQAELEMLIEKLDADKSGNIDYEEFAATVKQLDTEATEWESEQLSPELSNYKSNLRMQRGGGNSPAGGVNIKSSLSFAEKEKTRVVVEKVMQLVKGRENLLRNSLRRLDRDFDGKISYSEFKRGLVNMGITLNERDFVRFVREIDEDGDGSIDFNEFSRVFSDSAAQGPLNLVPEQKKMVRALREKLRGKTKNMTKLFLQFDRDGDGSVTMEEFKLGIKDFMAGAISEAQIAELSSLVETDEVGRVDYTEFAKFVGGSADEDTLTVFQSKRDESGSSIVRRSADRHQSMAELDAEDRKVLESVFSKLVGRNDQMRKVLTDLDYDKDDCLSLSELKRGLVRLGISLPPVAFEKFLRALDVSNTGYVTVASMSEGLQAFSQPKAKGRRSKAASVDELPGEKGMSETEKNRFYFNTTLNRPPARILHFKEAPPLPRAQSVHPRSRRVSSTGGSDYSSGGESARSKSVPRRVSISAEQVGGRTMRAPMSHHHSAGSYAMGIVSPSQGSLLYQMQRAGM